jgi:hypothetical protein
MGKVTDLNYLGQLNEDNDCSRTEKSNFISSIFLFSSMSTRAVEPVKLFI